MSRRTLALCCVGCALVVLLIIILSLQDCSAKAKCREGGGSVQEYDCNTVMICQPVGKITVCNPTRVCEWRCIQPTKRTD